MHEKGIGLAIGVDSVQYDLILVTDSYQKIFGSFVAEVSAILPRNAGTVWGASTTWLDLTSVFFSEKIQNIRRCLSVIVIHQR